MKKVFKIRPLGIFLTTSVLFTFCFLAKTIMITSSAFSRSLDPNFTTFPLKRPSDLFNYEESVNTIFNMIQKKGGKEIGDVQTTSLKKNENLYDLLTRLNFNSKNINNITISINSLPNSKKILSSLPIGMNVNYSLPSEIIGGAIKLSYNKTTDIFIWQDVNNTYNTQITPRPTVLQETLVKGTIKSNLYTSAVKAGIPENTLFEMVRFLGFSIDFQREIRKGDSFEVLFTKQIDLLKDKVIDTKAIKFVSITLSGKKLSFFKYTDEQGFNGYYDLNGRSSKRTLMRTPINGARLSSKYGNRKHPILGYTKMHRGIDFAAPRGTPVFAAGDGVIEKAGRNGSYGIYIRIRHTGNYKTAYAHLSGVHKKIKVGRRVSQGKIIGYLGSSGRSTGPHLHYEVIFNNKQVNPMRIKFPSGKNIKKKNLIKYKLYIQETISTKIRLEKALATIH